MNNMNSLRVNGAMAFVAAAFKAATERHLKKVALAAQGKYVNDPTNGRSNYRGGPGTAAVKRAAVKRRNIKRHRAACRG